MNSAGNVDPDGHPMNWIHLFRGMRRYAWAGAQLWLVVAIGSAVGSMQAPAQYVATQGITVTLVPIGGPTAANQQRLDAQAVTIARMIASPDFLASHQFTTAVSQQQATQGGSTTSNTFSPEHVSDALSATHAGARITLSASSSSSTQAVVLVQTATQALTVHAADLLPPQDETTIRLVPDQSAPLVARDTATDDAARNLLLTHLGLATATALLLVLALGWIASRTPNDAIASTTERQGTETGQTRA